MSALRTLKAAATRREHQRVYGNMSTPRDIVVEHGGKVYIRRAWSGFGFFGWDRWEVAA